MTHSSGRNFKTCWWSILLAGSLAASQTYRGRECQLAKHCDVSISGCQRRAQIKTLLYMNVNKTASFWVLWLWFLLYIQGHTCHHCVLSYSKPSVQLRANKEVAGEVRGHWGRVWGRKDSFSLWIKCDRRWLIIVRSCRCFKPCLNLEDTLVFS